MSLRDKLNIKQTTKTTSNKNASIEHKLNQFCYNAMINALKQNDELKQYLVTLDKVDVFQQVKDDEVIGTITAKPISERGTLKDKYLNFCNEKAYSLLSQTDWEVIKAVELGTTISDKLKTYMSSVRSKCNELQNSINTWAEDTSIDDFKKILDPVGDNSKALIDDWPLLELE